MHRTLHTVTISLGVDLYGANLLLLPESLPAFVGIPIF